MKLKHLSLPMIAMVVLGIVSCQKESKFPEKARQTIAEKLQHKWQIKSITTNSHFAGVDNQTTYPGALEEYVEFRADGKMYTYFHNKLDTSSYSVVSDKTIAIDNDQATIRELTDHSLVLFSKDNADTFGFFEITYNLTK